MTNNDQMPASLAAGLLQGFTDTQGAAALLNRAAPTVIDMVNRGLLTRFRVGAAVLYWEPQVREVADALRRLELRDQVAPVPDAGRAL